MRKCPTCIALMALIGIGLAMIFVILMMAYNEDEARTERRLARCERIAASSTPDGNGEAEKALLRDCLERGW